MAINLGCWDCKEVKPAEEFPVVRSLKRGRAYRCRHCQKAWMRKKNYAAKYHQNNKERINAYHKEYDATHPEIKRDAAHKRRAILRGHEHSDQILIQDLFTRDNGFCKLCGSEVNAPVRNDKSPLAATIDHIIPISKGGQHIWENVQLAHDTCNKRKWAHLPEEMH